MFYYLNEILNLGEKRDAGGKAPCDIYSILDSSGFSEIVINTPKPQGHVIKEILNFSLPIYGELKKKTSVLQRGDTFFFQYPDVGYNILLGNILKNLRKNGIRTVAIIHDLESFRAAMSEDQRMSVVQKGICWKERNILENLDVVIGHNNIMNRKLREMTKAEIISLDIFDYLVDGYDERRMDQRAIEKDLPVIIAGNLSSEKSGYVYNLPMNQEFNLFGINYQDRQRDNVHYFGSFTPDDLPYNLTGSFGLVWDGPSSETCAGVYGKYLTINNPHKTSLYLASGIPVAIWKNAALARYVEENGCGITVNSLSELNSVISSLTDEEYNEMKEKAKKTGEKLRLGWYTKQAINKL